jgi:AcrR family transcriptional regulator
MPRSEEANARIREVQRRRLMNAAIRVFAHKGLAGAKMADVATEAGVSYGLAYHYFKSKEQLFAELVDWSTAGGRSVYLQALARPGTPWERLEWLTETILYGLRRYPETALVVIQAWTNEATPEPLRGIIMARSMEGREALIRLIREGQAAGQVVSGDPNQLASLYDACISGLSATAFPADVVPGATPTAQQILRMLRT